MFPSVWTNPRSVLFDQFYALTDQQYSLFDVTADESSITVHAELPGYKQEEIEITLQHDKKLTVSAERKNGTKKTFHRTLMLPVKVDGDSASAKLENGVLSITFARHKDSLPKRIAISS